MEKAIKRNLLLISRKYIIFILLLIIFFLSDAFIIAIPIITFIAILSIEEFYKNKYNIIFSMPITRTEFAKAQYKTLLLVFGVTVMITLGLYAITVIVGINEPKPPIIFLLELSLCFMISMIIGGIGIVAGNKLSVFHILIILFVIDNLDIPTYIVQNEILTILISIIFLVIGRFAYILTKENVLRIYTEMEL